jgi:hypothetical protein
MSPIYPLFIPARPALKAVPARPQPGFRYRISPPNPNLTTVNTKLADFDPQQSGMLGNYQANIDKSVVAAVDFKDKPVYGYVWDNDLLEPTALLSLMDADAQNQIRHNNHLTLLDAGLLAPEVRELNGNSLLYIAPHFELEWSTSGFASQLGLLQLVETSRSLQLENGESVVLTDSPAHDRNPVLYLGDSFDTEAIKTICGYQAKADKQRFRFSRPVSQPIPTQINGKQVVSVSVLEKHICYFMQNARPDLPLQFIWTPVHLPIVWGWSIRVQQRFDGIWDIFRKKLILPTPSTELPRLPVWQRNSLQCSPSTQVI